VSSHRTTIEIPDPGLVVLAGPAGCGKSTFARRHFEAGDVVSSDAARELVAGDAADQSATPDAFALLAHILDKRCRRRRLTVIDATSTTRRERARLLGVAHRHQLPAVVIAFDLPLELCQQRARDRRDRPVPADVVARQHEAFRRHLEGLADEPFDAAVVLTSVEQADAVEVRRRPEHPTSHAAEAVPSHAVRAARAPAAIIDLDGTLTSAAWRTHHLEGRRRDWEAFFAGMGRDAPVRPLVELTGWVAHHATVVLLTGRPDDHEPVVRRWLADHGVVYDVLLMRPGGDRRPDTVVKREIYRREIAPVHDVRLVIEDRPHVVEMWREEGLYVLTAVDPHHEPLPPP
jgi:predicted kinase